MQIAKPIINKTLLNNKRFLNALIFFSLFLLAVQFFLVNSPSVAGASLLEKQEGFGSAGEIEAAFGSPQEDVRVTVAKVVKVFLGFMGITFVILMLSAGYKWMTAAGNESKVEEARETISRAVVGLIIILLAWSITQFVTDCVLKATGGTFSVWACPQI